MFAVPSGVLFGTRATSAASAAGRRRAVTARRTDAHRVRKRVEDGGCGRPGVNAGRTGRGSGFDRTLGGDVPDPNCAPYDAVVSPTATAPIPHARSPVRVIRSGADAGAAAAPVGGRR